MKWNYSVPIFTLILLFALLGWLAIRPQLGGAMTEIPSVVFTNEEKVYFTFINNTTKEKVVVSGTLAEHDLMANQGINPTLAGHTFHGANKGFATATPILKDNEYTYVGPDEASTTPLYRVKRPGKSEEIKPYSEL